MATFRFSLAEFRIQVLNAPWMVEEMRSRAEAGMDFAIAISPRSYDEHDDEIGERHYQDSFDVDAHTNGGREGDRAEAVLLNTSGHARYLEYGTEYMEPRAILRQALGVMRG